MSLAIWLWLNCLDFLINQASRFKNALQLQLIRREANIDADTTNQSMTLSVNGLKYTVERNSRRKAKEH